MDDEDQVMEEGDEEEEEEERFGSPYGKSVSPEDLVAINNSNMSPRFARHQGDFARFDMLGGASPGSWNDPMDEKGESVALMMHLEKTAIHQNFFDSFDDDFDEEDLA
ncbi:hypothetical protein INT47_012836 [Mucor saturninus]|uniref:Uncharacterized protein n=1 Tax=Mucor saturninus TaxID=64648 RepID=A0A8H7UXS4_9FUNG|nr:hypothetical protein INT47_012836 [Mucor saturninus]